VIGYPPGMAGAVRAAAEFDEALRNVRSRLLYVGIDADIDAMRDEALRSAAEGAGRPVAELQRLADREISKATRRVR